MFQVFVAENSLVFGAAAHGAAALHRQVKVCDAIKHTALFKFECTYIVVILGDDWFNTVKLLLASPPSSLQPLAKGERRASCKRVGVAFPVRQQQRRVPTHASCRNICWAA